MMLALLLAAQVALAGGDPPHRMPGPPPAAEPVSQPPAPSAPTPSPVISLHYGDVVVFRPAIEPGASPVIVAAGDAARGRALQAGELRARLDKFGQGESLLVVESMSSSFLDYQAVMTLPDGTSRPTTVCTLLSGGRQSFEHWPQVIATLTLFGFHPAPEQAASCH